MMKLYNEHTIKPIFWPDLATAHYTNATMAFLKENDVIFIEKKLNPLNCPQLRPIERYWALVKRNMCLTGKVATTIPEFKKIWRASALKVTLNVVQALMKRIRAKVRLFHRCNTN